MSLHAIGDRVTFVSVHDDVVLRVTGTVVGLASAPGEVLVKVEGSEEWRASEALSLVQTSDERRLP